MNIFKRLNKYKRSVFPCLFTIFYCLSSSAQKSSWVQGGVFNPQHFVKNEGQFDGWVQVKEPVLFGINEGLDQFQFTKNGVVSRIVHIEDGSGFNESKEYEEERIETKSFFVRSIWENANPNTIVEAFDKVRDYHTYVVHELTTDERKGVKADGYKKLVYHDLYPGIDLEYTFVDKKVGYKYSLIVKPGADYNQIKFSYSGSEMEKLSINQEGDLIITLPKGEYLKEHAPEAWVKETIEKVACKFRLENNSVSFSIPEGYDKSQTLIIDPWVVNSLANLTTTRAGYDIDFDNFGNLYVYGGYSFFANPCKVEKYNGSGIRQWTFNGTVSIPSWPTGWWNGTRILHYVSNFAIEQPTGRMYIGELCDLGAQTARINPSGIYDNFISNRNLSANEIWDYLFDCKDGNIYVFGGGTRLDINMGVLDTSTRNVSLLNITGVYAGTNYQDIVCGTIDNTGELYVMIASEGTPSVDNRLFKVNSAKNGNIWQRPTGYNSFLEGAQKRLVGTALGRGGGNSFNGLTINDNYLYYYDGKYIKVFNKLTGTVVGTPFVIANHNEIEQGGVYVDNCDNIYVGGIGKIDVYHFDGNQFNALGSIPLNAGLSNNHVNDIRYFGGNHSLYVCGEDFVGVYDAVYSHSCTPRISVEAKPTCQGIAIAEVTTSTLNPSLTYKWVDNNGRIIATTTNTSLLQDSIANLLIGHKYTVQVLDNSFCSTPIAIDTVIITSSVTASFIASPQPTTILNTDISFTNRSTNAVQYSWKLGDPNNSTSNSVHISQTYPLSPGTYTVELIALDQFGCADTVSQIIVINDISVAWMPNTFTPNGDGYNEVFLPVLTGYVELEYEFLIFNRWGELIYKTNQIGKGWDGMVDNREAQQDVYVWKLQFLNEEKSLITEVGHVNLLR